MDKKPKPTRRQKQRAKTFPNDEGVKRLADLLGCHWRTVYRFEEPGNEHLPRNAVVRKCYEALLREGEAQSPLEHVRQMERIGGAITVDKMRRAVYKANR